MNALAKITDFADVYAGGGAPQNADDFSENGIPFLRAGSLPKLLNGAKESDLEKITNEVAKKHKLQLHKKGSVVFAKSGMSATKGHIYRLKDDCYVVNHLAVIKPNANCDSNYLEHALKKYSPTTMILDAAYPSIRLSDISDFKIPLPPLAEQRRIAAILDKAAEIKAKREQAIAKLDELAQSTFVEMFGSSIENEGVELRSICDRVTDGTHQSPEWVDGGIPFIFISNIVNGEINLKSNKFISNNTYEELTRNCQINVGDILYTTVGSYGNVALVRDESKFAFQRHIAHIKPKQDIVNSRFMATMLGCTFVRRQVDKVARGVAQKTVNLGDLAKLKVICPPIKLQQEFAKRVELIETLKVKQIKASVSATQLISSLQHQAFTTGFNA